jgi:hypothetical protein
MSHLVDLNGAQLASSLDALGIRFIMVGQGGGEISHISPPHLIAALASSDEARLRLALIPLFLERPDYVLQVRTAVHELTGISLTTLQCYYTAAIFLQQKYRSRLDDLVGVKPSLPDLFSKDLGLSMVDDPDVNLTQLAARHQQLSGLVINWYGTYEHAILKWLAQLERHIEKSGK